MQYGILWTLQIIFSFNYHASNSLPFQFHYEGTLLIVADYSNHCLRESTPP